MSLIQRAAEVNCSQSQMFDLVNDIAAYPEYITWIQATEIEKQTKSEVIASITVASMGYCRTFKTHNYLQSPKMMEIKLLDGPFNHLTGFWHFKALGDFQSRVCLHLEFELSEGLLSRMVVPVIEKMSGLLVQSFVSRAEKVYGKL